MSKNRQRLGSPVGLWLLLMAAGLAPLVAPLAWGGSPGAAAPGSVADKSPHVILSGEFFSAMEKLASSGVVTGDPQQQFLEQIAVAQRFTVKTNLTLIQQNEKIIRLLEELVRQRQGSRN